MTKEKEKPETGLHPDIEEWYGHPTTEQFFRFTEKVLNDIIGAVSGHIKAGQPVDAGFHQRAAEASAFARAATVYLTPAAFNVFAESERK